MDLIECACGCKQLRPKIDNRGRIRKFINYHGTRGLNNPWWKGGQYIHNGYRFIWKPDHSTSNPDGYIQEHRYVYEQYHNCCLLSWIEIHHINGNTLDNKIQNLQPLTKSEHSMLHRLVKRIEIDKRKCILCSKDHDNHWRRFGDGFVCSGCYTREYRKRRLFI